METVLELGFDPGVCGAVNDFLCFLQKINVFAPLSCLENTIWAFH